VSQGLLAQLEKYSEALELIWFQYVVAYDKQEQRSLVTSLRNQLLDLRRASIAITNQAQAAISGRRNPILLVITLTAALVVITFLAWRIRRLGWARGLKVWQEGRRHETSPVDFYDRLLRILEKHGFSREKHQTPLEFAAVVGINEAALITS